MALTIRLRQQGRTNRKFYRLVVTDSRRPRDGEYLESIGWYDPCASQEDKELFLKPDRAEHWLSLGAMISDKAKALVARAAPAVIRAHTEKQIAHRTKAAAKKRASRKTKVLK